LTAIAGSDADGRIDLMTVVTHELGHLLGMDHDATALMDSNLDTGIRETVPLVEVSAGTGLADDLEQYGILVNSLADWEEPTIGNSPQAYFPDAVYNNPATGDVQTEAPVATLVFDEVSGEFVEIENAPAANPGTEPASPEDIGVAGDGDWVVYDEAGPSTGDSGISSDTSTASESANAIDWDAGAGEVNDLLPPPKPGRSGMKHSGANGSKAN
jgi:hypothetical protein